MQAPLRHLSIRVPWHDQAWNGTICKAPAANSACLCLKNIAGEKQDAAEEALKGKSVESLAEAEIPPGVKDRAPFMAPFASTRHHSHQYCKTSPDTLGLTHKELRIIYRIQFPVMRQSEADTWYDQRGRIIFTNSKGLPGVGLTRAEWNEVKPLQSGTVTQTKLDTTLPTGPIERLIEYHAPFTRSDRETDYATVWRKSDERTAS